MRCVALVFPHQLYESHPVLRKKTEKVLLVEHSLFFGDSQYPMRFHPKKIAFHRETMTAFETTLKQSGVVVERIAYQGGTCELDNVLHQLSQNGVAKIYCVEPCDYALEKRLLTAAQAHMIELAMLPNPGFLNTSEQNREWRSTRKRWHMADFYTYGW